MQTEDPEAARVLSFWIDEVGQKGWYSVDRALDRLIAAEFGDPVRQALAGGLGGWRTSARGTLALLILLDQFTRNIFRGTAGAHAGDARARALANGAIARGLDLRIDGPARQFFYLPLMHSESLPDQERCVRLFLMRLPDPENLHHAIQHRAVIRRFGRFPSRNRALGRTDTDAERAYRAGGGYMG